MKMMLTIESGNKMMSFCKKCNKIAVFEESANTYVKIETIIIKRTRKKNG